MAGRFVTFTLDHYIYCPLILLSSTVRAQSIIRLGSRSESEIMQSLGLLELKMKSKTWFTERQKCAKNEMRESFLALRGAFVQSKILVGSGVGTSPFANCTLARLLCLLKHFHPASAALLRDIVSRYGSLAGARSHHLYAAGRNHKQYTAAQILLPQQREGWCERHRIQELLQGGLRSEEFST